MSVKNAADVLQDGCSCRSIDFVDVVRAFANLADRISDLALGLDSLETRLGSIENLIR